MKSIIIITKWFFIFIIVLLFAVNIFIVISGRFYLFKAVVNTYFKGKSGPSIDEYGIFPNRKVAAGNPLPWKFSKEFNKKNFPDSLLDEFLAYKTVAYLIIKDDSICFERYWDNYSDTSYSNSFSMAKSIVSILTGIAIHDGKIKSITQHVSDFIPSFKEGMDSLLEIKELLTMSSGIDFEESYTSPIAYPAEAYYGDDLMKVTLKYNVVTKPGLRFKYLSGNTTLLGYIVSVATGKKLSDYASEKLWQQVGAEHPAYWSTDHDNGMEKAYCCFNSDARDFARIGQLYLDSGRWEGKQIVPEEYVLQSIKPSLVPYYGYNWWILHCGGHTVPYCRGILGQYIFIIPDENMVIVRLGKKRGPVLKPNTPLDGLKYVNAGLIMYGK